MCDLIGHEEGLQLFEELQVQNGAQTVHLLTCPQVFYKNLLENIQKTPKKVSVMEFTFSKVANFQFVTLFEAKFIVDFFGNFVNFSERGINWTRVNSYFSQPAFTCSKSIEITSE